jgi:hypothetical protein
MWIQSTSSSHIYTKRWEELVILNIIYGFPQLGISYILLYAQSPYFTVLGGKHSFWKPRGYKLLLLRGIVKLSLSTLYWERDG